MQAMILLSSMLILVMLITESMQAPMDPLQQRTKQGRPRTIEKRIPPQQDLETISLHNLIAGRKKYWWGRLTSAEFDDVLARHPTMQNLPYDKPEELADTLANLRFEETSCPTVRGRMTEYIVRHLDGVEGLPEATKEHVKVTYKEQQRQRKVLRNRDRRHNLSTVQQTSYRKRRLTNTRNRRIELQAKSSSFMTRFEFLLHENHLSMLPAKDIEEATRSFREYYAVRKQGKDQYLNEMLQFLTDRQDSEADILAAKEAREDYIRRSGKSISMKSKQTSQGHNEESKGASEEPDSECSHSESENRTNEDATSSTKTQSAPARLPQSYSQHDIITDQLQYQHAAPPGTLHCQNTHINHHATNYGTDVSFYKYDQDNPLYMQNCSNELYSTFHPDYGHSFGEHSAYPETQSNQVGLSRSNDYPLPAYGQLTHNLEDFHKAAAPSQMHDIQVPDNLDIFLTDFPDIPFDPQTVIQHPSSSGSVNFCGTDQAPSCSGEPSFPWQG